MMNRDTDAHSYESDSSHDDNELIKSKSIQDDCTLTSNTTTTSRAKTRRRLKPNRNKKAQHTLTHLRQHISHLISIYETNGWFIPLQESEMSGKCKDGKGKVWSNRNYGADKKRQRKQNERCLLEGRIEQLENVLREEHDVDDLEK